MFYLWCWLFLVLFYIKICTVTPAVPIDIVTEKITGRAVIHRPAIVPMIPEKDPIYRKQYEDVLTTNITTEAELIDDVTEKNAVITTISITEAERIDDVTEKDTVLTTISTDAEPIDIVTQTPTDSAVLFKPDLDPHGDRSKRWITSTIPWAVYLKYQASQYVEDYDIPFINMIEPKHKVPSLMHGKQLIKEQIFPVMKYLFYGDGFKTRRPHPYGTMSPRDLIEVTDSHRDLQYVDFYWPIYGS